MVFFRWLTRLVLEPYSLLVVRGDRWMAKTQVLCIIFPVLCWPEIGRVLGWWVKDNIWCTFLEFIVIEHLKCVDHSLWADPTTSDPWLTNGQFNAEMVEMLTHLLGCVVEHVWTRHWWGRQVWHCPWFILLFYLAEEELLSWAITIGLLNESLPLASVDLWLGVCWCYDMSHERMWVCEIDRPNSLQFRTLLRTLLLEGLPPLPTQLFDWLLTSQRCHPMCDCRPPPTQIGIWHQHIWHQRIWHLQLSI